MSKREESSFSFSFVSLIDLVSTFMHAVIDVFVHLLYMNILSFIDLSIHRFTDWTSQSVKSKRDKLLIYSFIHSFIHSFTYLYFCLFNQ